METPSTVATTTTTSTAPSSRKFSFRSRRSNKQSLQRQPSLDDSHGSAASRLRRGTALLRRLPRRIPRAVVQQQEPSGEEDPLSSSPLSSTSPTSLLITAHDADSQPLASNTLSLDPAPVPKPPLPTATTVIPLQQHRSSSDALATWSTTVQELVQSDAWGRVVQASRLVVHQLGQDVLYITLLPLTIPQHVCQTITHSLMDMALQIMETAMEQQQKVLMDETHSPTKQRTQPSPSTAVSQPGGMPGFLLGVTTNIVVSVVMPLFMGSPSSPPPPKKVNGEYPDYLDKLRLDYVPKHLRRMDGAMEPKQESCDRESSPMEGDDDDATTESSSHHHPHRHLPKHLMLRMDDLLGLSHTICTDAIDLHPDHMDRGLTRTVLDAFVSTALRLMATNTALQLPLNNDEATDRNLIRWHPEGSTRHLLERSDEKLDHTATLVWSGKWTDPSPPRKPHTIYMARGVILPLSPLALLRLLWDNDRVQEYNPYCVERSTLVSVAEHECDADAAVLHNVPSRATKIITTVMRVAGLTVTAHNLMHVVRLPSDTDENDAFLLVGRSLDDSQGHSQRNAIVWGCNLLRPTTNGAVELTSLSQVASSVPHFVAHKIGLNGIADFFRKVRNAS